MIHYLASKRISLKQKLIGWLLTPIHLTACVAIFLAFHPLQVIGRWLSYSAHKTVVDYMSLFVLASLRLIGAKVEFISKGDLPSDRPLLLIANHQSLYDIPAICWFFRSRHPKFVAKKELGKGLPSISYNLRYGGSVLIDRENLRQALPALGRFGEYIERQRYAACIFPEGTRARDGVVKPFKEAGILKLLRAMPTVAVVPVAIEGSWELMRYRMRPIPFGVRLRCTVLPAIETKECSARQVIKQVERSIRTQLGQQLGTIGASWSASSNHADGLVPKAHVP